ncbi:ArdC-like ssDNA-binding domain-containing protein [Alkalihalobacterium alkalicellulosilyticum]|uniref:ArdC-like ssDNA-binding domain-containing protein n=1 Tax=Alkalihalobacterium alkalicellulosilyticum TaxID=1912214 RepID=UPI001FE733CD|nr:ArdC-like ssDNA-binding domain-containing protein [Bacillus alkalicellulosilyticus]
MKKQFKVSQHEQVERLIKTLEEGVTNFSYSPEQFKALLEMKAIMPQYSFKNIMVAKAQLPHASFLAGFTHWNNLGRTIKKGCKAIRIFKPKFAKRTDDCGEEIEQIVGFITVPVFDYSQTEGAPLPIDKLQLTLDGDSDEARQIINWAETLAEEDDCPITYGDAGDANGYYLPSFHSITVSDSLSINQRCKTLIHELVHSKVDRYSHDKTTKEEKEVVAEGTAFVICTYFGLDTSDYSFGYVKSWSKHNDQAVLMYGEKICNTAKLIINEFERIKEKEQQLQSA